MGGDKKTLQSLSRKQLHSPEPPLLCIFHIKHLRFLQLSPPRIQVSLQWITSVAWGYCNKGPQIRGLKIDSNFSQFWRPSVLKFRCGQGQPPSAGSVGSFLGLFSRLVQGILELQPSLQPLPSSLDFHLLSASVLSSCKGTSHQIQGPLITLITSSQDR